MVFLTALMAGADAESLLFVILSLFLMAVFGYVIFKKMIWDLADEVYDEGISLLFIRDRKRHRVYLREIMNISYSQMQSPERITIHLRTESPFGKEIAFIPPMRLNPFSKSPVFSELIERVDRAKS